VSLALTTALLTPSLHDALPISPRRHLDDELAATARAPGGLDGPGRRGRHGLGPGAVRPDLPLGVGHRLAAAGRGGGAAGHLPVRPRPPRAGGQGAAGAVRRPVVHLPVLAAPHPAAARPTPGDRGAVAVDAVGRR